MPTVLISGANRGLGLEFARQYAADGWSVIAGARDPGRATELNALAAGGRVRVLPLDVADDASVAAFARAVGDAPLDVVIANAGVFGGDAQHRLGEIDSAAFMATLNTNTAGPLRLANALLPNLKAARGKLVAITSQMGSIADAGTGYLGYRASKAALNMVWHVLAGQLKAEGVIAVPVHPGWVQTDMGGASAPLTPEVAVKGMRDQIAAYADAHAGRFLTWEGKELPW